MTGIDVVAVGIDVAAVALVAGGRSAIKRRREGAGLAELIARAYLADQRIAAIKSQTLRALHDMEGRARPRPTLNS